MLKRRLVTSILLATLTLLTVSCANSNSGQNNQQIYKDYIVKNQLESVKKITSFQFHAWRSLDNRNLILSTSFNRPYLITLSNYCVDLSHANAIRVNNSGSILQVKFDSIIPVRNHGGKCLIDSIYKISREQANQLTSLKKSDKKQEDRTKA